MRGTLDCGTACPGSRPHPTSSPSPSAPTPCMSWRRLSSRGPRALLICVSRRESAPCPVLRAVYGRARGWCYWLDDYHIIGGAAGVYQKRSSVLKKGLGGAACG